jgi:hypothetical protein
MKRLSIGAAILGITLLNFFQFPGHTWLQSDTQIYAPILEHMWDPTVLQKDLIAQHPHVAFTLYDETAIALRWATSLDFRRVLEAEQFLFRALGIWGVYLIATALGLSDISAILVAAVFSLGAFINGPTVVIFEYEPVPRGFAVLLVFLAVGLAAHQRFLGAGIAASVAFLYHAPTAAPFWAVYLCLVLWPANPPVARRRLIALGVLATALLVLLAASLRQAAPGEMRAFLSRLDPYLEQLQRMRAGYNWISLWWRQLLAHYLILYAAAALACWRLRRDFTEELRFFAAGLPLIGIASMPISYLLLEKLHWALIPQFQPMRALLFVTAFAMILGVAAAYKAVAGRRYTEALVWMALIYLPPANRDVEWPGWNRASVIIVLAMLAVVAFWAIQSRARWWKLAVTAAILAPYWLIPGWGRMQNYPPLHTPELAQLSQWARRSTPKDAVFLFPDAGRELYPGVFRVEALRSVYADWKTGGQVNFSRDLGEEWWSRWQKTMAAGFDPHHLGDYRAMGIGYIVLLTKDRLPGTPPVFENTRFVAYKL